MYMYVAETNRETHIHQFGDVLCIVVWFALLGEIVYNRSQSMSHDQCMINVC